MHRNKLIKFGQDLHRYQAIERTTFYIAYQALKQSYKLAQSSASAREQDIDLTGLPFDTFRFIMV